MAGSPTWCARELFSPTVWGFLFTGNRVSPLGFEGCVGRSDGGAVAAFEDEGGGDGRLDDVGGCVGGGSRWCEAVFDVVPRVQFVRVPFVCVLFVFVRVRMVCACFLRAFLLVMVS